MLEEDIINELERREGMSISLNKAFNKTLGIDVYGQHLRAEREQEIQVGCLVRLKSGGPNMYVSRKFYFANKIVALWSDGKTTQSHIFDMRMVEVVK